MRDGVRGNRRRRASAHLDGAGVELMIRWVRAAGRCQVSTLAGARPCDSMADLADVLRAHRHRALSRKDLDWVFARFTDFIRRSRRHSDGIDSSVLAHAALQHSSHMSPSACLAVLRAALGQPTAWDDAVKAVSSRLLSQSATAPAQILLDAIPLLPDELARLALADALVRRKDDDVDRSLLAYRLAELIDVSDIVANVAADPSSTGLDLAYVAGALLKRPADLALMDRVLGRVLPQARAVPFDLLVECLQASVSHPQHEHPARQLLAAVTDRWPKQVPTDLMLAVVRVALRMGRTFPYQLALRASTQICLGDLDGISLSDAGLLCDMLSKSAIVGEEVVRNALVAIRDASISAVNRSPCTAVDIVVFMRKFANVEVTDPVTIPPALFQGIIPADNIDVDAVQLMEASRVAPGSIRQSLVRLACTRSSLSPPDSIGALWRRLPDDASQDAVSALACDTIRRLQHVPSSDIPFILNRFSRETLQRIASDADVLCSLRPPSLLPVVDRLVTNNVRVPGAVVDHVMQTHDGSAISNAVLERMSLQDLVSCDMLDKAVQYSFEGPSRARLLPVAWRLRATRPSLERDALSTLPVVAALADRPQGFADVCKLLLSLAEVGAEFSPGDRSVITSCLAFVMQSRQVEYAAVDELVDLCWAALAFDNGNTAHRRAPFARVLSIPLSDEERLCPLRSCRLHDIRVLSGSTKPVVSPQYSAREERWQVEHSLERNQLRETLDDDGMEFMVTAVKHGTVCPDTHVILDVCCSAKRRALVLEPDSERFVLSDRVTGDLLARRRMLEQAGWRAKFVTANDVSVELERTGHLPSLSSWMKATAVS